MHYPHGMYQPVNKELCIIILRPFATVLNDLSLLYAEQYIVYSDTILSGCTNWKTRVF